MRWFNLILGWFFLLLGVVGAFLPFLQGWLFAIPGFLLIAREQVWARRWLDWMCEKHPKAGEWIARIDGWITRTEERMFAWFRRVFGRASS